MGEMTPLFARQPIFDTQRAVIGYELLFRRDNNNSAQFIDGDQATSQVLVNLFSEQKIESFTGKHKAFINFTRNLLISPPDLPKDQIVIEVLEDMTIDDKLIRSLMSLKEKGFEIALDDFLITKETQKIICLADIIKIDVMNVSSHQLVDYVRKLCQLDVKLLAEKVEDYSMLMRCQELGFDYFQGYFLCKPEIIHGFKVTESKHAVIRLISQLNNPNISINLLVETISADPGLSYKILKLVNSSANGLCRKIESLSQAVTLLGINGIKNWATYLLMANNSNKPKELCTISMCRAKFCELLGLKMGDQHLSETCFTVGLLSNLDAFLNIPMHKLMQNLGLSNTIENAILNFEGIPGKILLSVISYEQGKWGNIHWDFFHQHQIKNNELHAFYRKSINWASEISRTQ